MSHFTVAIITLENQSIEELLAKYDENLEVTPYVSFTLEDKAKEKAESIKRIADGIKEKYNKKLKNEHDNNWLMWAGDRIKTLIEMTDEEYYRNSIYDDVELNEKGEPLTTYNPNSKWDWYQIGGRWTGLLEVKDGCFGDYGERSWTNRDEKYDKNRYDIAKIKDLVEYPKTFAMITPDGEWSEKGEMGWWGMSSETEESTKNFEEYQKEMFDKYMENGIVTIVDCHI